MPRRPRGVVAWPRLRSWLLRASAPPRLIAGSSRAVLLRSAMLLRAQATNARQGMSALLLSSAGDLAAGVAFGAMTGRLEELPGMIILIPAAIGMRGNIFGALGARLGTMVHTGQFDDPRRRTGNVGQSVTASALLSLYISVALAALAWSVAHLLSIGGISLRDFVVISVAGGLASSVFVLALTLGVAVLSVRRGWDMDNIATPVVTAGGDLVTLPTLWAASFLLSVPVLPTAILIATVVGMVVGVLYQVRQRAFTLLRSIMAQALPVLLVAGLIDVLAGYTIDRRAERFFTLPALLVLIPPFLEDVGALAGILAARLSSKLHLGTIEPSLLPGRRALEDISLTYMLALPVLVLVGTTTWIVSEALGFAHPGLGHLIAITLFAGALAVTGAIVVAYATAVSTFRRGLDPDNYGVPIITSSADLICTVSLVAALSTLGVV